MLTYAWRAYTSLYSIQRLPPLHPQLYFILFYFISFLQRNHRLLSLSLSMASSHFYSVSSPSSTSPSSLFVVLVLISWFQHSPSVFVNGGGGEITIPTTLEGPFPPVTVPFDSRLRGEAVDLPDTDPRVRRRVEGLEPEQISVSLSSTHDSVWISWISGSKPYTSPFTLYSYIYLFDLL